MSKRTWTSFGIWVGIVTGLWIVAWVIAEAIPVFNDLLGLISALFASWFTYGLSGVFWLWLNRGGWFKSKKKAALTVINFLIFCCGGAIVSSLSVFSIFPLFQPLILPFSLSLSPSLSFFSFWNGCGCFFVSIHFLSFFF